MSDSKRTYSHATIHAALLLGKQIKLGRKEHKWTETELADRAGISRFTLQKIEKGDLKCEIGLVFEVATLVGVKLFDVDRKAITAHITQADNKLALLPKRVRKVPKGVIDDF